MINTGGYRLSEEEMDDLRDNAREYATDPDEGDCSRDPDYR